MLKKCFVVLATWGQPVYWGDANYHYDGTSLYTCCSLMVLLKRIVDGYVVSSVKRVYLFGLDSVVDTNRVSEFCRKGDGGSICRNVVCRYIENGYRFDDGCFNDYHRLIEGVSKFYEHVYKELLEKSFEGSSYKDIIEGSSYKDIINSLRNVVKVVVLPALGSPGGLFRFVGSVEDYVALSLISLGEDLANLDKSLVGNCDNITVVFDSTHGINYSPVLTAKVSEIVAQILRLRYNINVFLEIYNSDPYPPKSSSDKPELNINRVFEKHVTEIEIPRPDDLKDFVSFSKNSRCVEEAKRNDKNLDNESTKNLRSVIDNKLKGIIKNVLASLYSPSPLALLYSCYDYQNYWKNRKDMCSSDSKCIKDFQELLSKIKNMWIENVKIRDKCIERSISIKLNTLWSLLITDSVCRHVENLIDKHQNPIYEIDQNTRSQAKNSIMFKLSLLKYLAENIYTRINFALNYLIQNEISIIEYLSKDKIKENECREYREISELKTVENTDKQRSQRISERNLIAHAGLLRDFVKICKQNNELYIGYKDTETIENIYKHLKNILKTV